MTRTCKDIAIRPHCSLRLTRNTPVFIKSPESQKQILREYAEVEARKSKDIHQLGSLGLARSQSWSQLKLVVDVETPKSPKKVKVERQLNVPASPVSMQDTRSPSPQLVVDSDDSDSEADSDGSLDDQDFEYFDIDSPVSSVSLWHAPEKTFKDAIRRRVNEQVMVVNLKHLTFKGQMRYGGRDSDSTGNNLTPGEVALRRQAVGLKAANFTELYSDTLGILEAHMTLEPPSRSRHTITNADLGTYTTLSEKAGIIRQVQSEKFAPRGDESPRKGLARSMAKQSSCPASLQSSFAFEPKDRAASANDIGDNLHAIEES